MPNMASQRETALDLFEVLINDVQRFMYDAPAPGISSMTLNNGNGYFDALLKTFDFNTFSAQDSVVFHAIVNNATDGKEQFFLIPSATAAVSEPAPIA